MDKGHGHGHRLPGVLPGAWPPPTTQAQAEISFPCVTERVSGPFGMKISLALRESALRGVTD